MKLSCQRGLFGNFTQCIYEFHALMKRLQISFHAACICIKGALISPAMLNSSLSKRCVGLPLYLPTFPCVTFFNSLPSVIVSALTFDSVGLCCQSLTFLGSQCDILDIACLRTPSGLLLTELFDKNLQSCIQLFSEFACKIVNVTLKTKTLLDLHIGYLKNAHY